jgi:predicted transcriptional regulator
MLLRAFAITAGEGAGGMMVPEAGFAADGGSFSPGGLPSFWPPSAYPYPAPSYTPGAGRIVGRPAADCVTMSYMKGTVTIRLDDELERSLDRMIARTGKTRSEIVRDALRRQLAVQRFEELREQVLPFAEARDLLTDEDVFATGS